MGRQGEQWELIDWKQRNARSITERTEPREIQIRDEKTGWIQNYNTVQVLLVMDWEPELKS